MVLNFFALADDEFIMVVVIGFERKLMLFVEFVLVFVKWDESLCRSVGFVEEVAVGKKEDEEAGPVSSKSSD